MNDEIIATGHRPNRSYFKKRLLKFEFIGGLDNKGKQFYFSDGGSRLEVQGFRATVVISFFNAINLPSMRLSIYNLPKSLSDEISTLGQFTNVPNQLCHQIIVYASTDYSDEANPRYVKVYQGSILISRTDYSSAPDIITHIEATTCGGFTTVPCPYVSFKGKVSSENIVRAIVNNFKLSIATPSFQTQNVEAIKNNVKNNPVISHVVNIDVYTAINNPHFSGDLITQLNQCAMAGSFNYNIQDSVLYIFPANKTLDIQKVQGTGPLRISPENGMIGYPEYADQGMLVTILFKPYLLFGQAIEIYQSFVKPACGLWPYMISMQHNISCLTPNGKWETQILMAKRLIKGGFTNE